MEKERDRSLMEHFDEAMSQMSFTDTVHPDAGRVHPGLCEAEGWAEANKTKYEYKPLKSDKRQFHLLALAPAEEWQEPIQCGLFPESLDNLRVFL